MVVEHAVMVGYTSWVVVYLVTVVVFEHSELVELILGVVVLSITVVVLVSTEHSELVELIAVHVVRLQLYLALSLSFTWTSILALRSIISFEQMISLMLQDALSHIQSIVQSSVDKIINV